MLPLHEVPDYISCRIDPTLDTKADNGNRGKLCLLNELQPK